MVLLFYISIIVFDHPLAGKLEANLMPIPGHFVWFGSPASGLYAFTCLYTYKYLYLVVVGFILLVGVIGPVALLLANPERAHNKTS
jgi:hypothetical protein